ncbi:MAG: SDR family oxidoreductase [Chloroflexi bacterium]|nr:SDR family oxidoreductase [Chloroflexota bacterium]
MIDPHLAEATALVTGANHGIGRAIALAFARVGVKLFLSWHIAPPRYDATQHTAARETGSGGAALYDANQQNPGEAVLAELAAMDAQAAGMPADLADPAAPAALIEACRAQLGAAPDIMVVNHTHCVLETFDPALAEVKGEFPLALVSAEEIDRHMQINARAFALLVCAYTSAYLAREAKWGRIIAISTDAASAHAANISYAASKHAIESYARSAAAELGKYGITVNIVAPGPIQTGYITPKQAGDIAAGTPLGRVGEPEDIADVVVFLASCQARWLTGQLLYAGGGWRMPQ